MLVYLLHFSEPYHHARHYLGWTEDFQARFQLHLSGRGSPLVKAAIEKGIKVTLSRIWEDQDRNFERKLKNQKNTPKLCPICKGEV